jgi:hypothetical protein
VHAFVIFVHRSVNFPRNYFQAVHDRGRKTACAQILCKFLSIHSSIPKKYSILLAALIATLGLTACEKTTVVPIPAAAVVAVPGLAGESGTTGHIVATGATMVIVFNVSTAIYSVAVVVLHPPALR